MLWGHKKKYILDMKESQNRKNHRKNHINHMPKVIQLANWYTDTGALE